MKLKTRLKSINRARQYRTKLDQIYKIEKLEELDKIEIFEKLKKIENDIILLTHKELDFNFSR